MATAPGQSPMGADRFSNPYSFSPMTNRTLAPLFANGSQMTQMLGMFAPIIMQMVAPEMSTQLQAMSNINPGLMNQAKRLQDLQTTFSRAQSAHQTAAIGRFGQAAGLSQGSIDNVTKYLPMLTAVMPQLGNTLSRFDISGAGFGYDAAMMSMARAGGLSADRIDPNSAAAVAKLYAGAFQRKGAAGSIVDGVDVIDITKTKGLTIAEMAQQRAGLTARGIVGDVYAGTNDVSQLVRFLSHEDQILARGANSVMELSQRGITSDRINDARKGVIGSNLDASRETETKYAEVVHKMGSVFTSMQGNTEELLRMVEKLHGPLAKLNTDDLEKSMTKFVKLLDVSGLQAEELAKGTEVFMARTGTADRGLAMQVVAQTAGSRRGAMRSGGSEEGSMRIASDAADLAGEESKRLVGRGMGAFMTDEGLKRLAEAERTVADPNADPEKRAEAMRVLTDPLKEGLIDPMKASEAQAYRQREITGQVNADERRARIDATSRRMGVSTQERAELGTKVIAGSLLSRLDQTLQVVGKTASGAASKAAAKEQIAKWLGKNAKDITEAELAKWTAGAVVAAAPNGGGENLAFFLASMGIHGEKAEQIKEEMLAGGLGGLSNAIGATTPELARQLTAGMVLGVDTRQANASTEADIRDKWANHKVYHATNAATATLALLEKSKGGLGFKDFVVGAFQGLGVLAPGQEFSKEQIDIIEKSGWGREYAAIMKLPEAERKERMAILAGDMAHALKLGNRDVETFLGGESGLKTLLEKFGESKTLDERKAEAAKAALNEGKQETRIVIGFKGKAGEMLDAQVEENARRARELATQPPNSRPSERR
jgi:hypothetical protein